MHHTFQQWARGKEKRASSAVVMRLKSFVRAYCHQSLSPYFSALGTAITLQGQLHRQSSAQQCIPLRLLGCFTCFIAMLQPYELSAVLLCRAAIGCNTNAILQYEPRQALLCMPHPHAKQTEMSQGPGVLRALQIIPRDEGIFEHWRVDKLRAYTFTHTMRLLMPAAGCDFFMMGSSSSVR